MLRYVLPTFIYDLPPREIFIFPTFAPPNIVFRLRFNANLINGRSNRREIQLQVEYRTSFMERITVVG